MTSPSVGTSGHHHPDHLLRRQKYAESAPQLRAEKLAKCRAVQVEASPGQVDLGEQRMQPSQRSVGQAHARLPLRDTELLERIGRSHCTVEATRSGRRGSTATAGPPSFDFEDVTLALTDTGATLSGTAFVVTDGCGGGHDGRTWQLDRSLPPCVERRRSLESARPGSACEPMAGPGDGLGDLVAGGRVELEQRAAPAARGHAGGLR